MTTMAKTNWWGTAAVNLIPMESEIGQAQPHSVHWSFSGGDYKRVFPDANRAGRAPIGDRIAAILDGQASSLAHG
jgi:hypothetical protein